MNQHIAIFAYDFPHQKSSDFIKDILSYGIKNLVVLGAPKKNLSSVIRLRAKVDLSMNAEPLNTHDLCFNLGLPYYVVEHDDDGVIKSLASEYNINMAIISGARIIPKKVIQIFPNGMVNFHPGKIPETSGLDSFPYTLKKGVAAGVTTHFIDCRVDAGDFVRFNSLSIEATDNIPSVQKKIYELQRKALQEFCKDYISSNIIKKKIDRPFKNSPMDQAERLEAFSLFEAWKSKNIYLQNLNFFFEACETGYFQGVSDMLLFDSSLINSNNGKGHSPLIVACFNQHIEIVKLLLDSGANPNQCGSNGTTPLMYAKTKIMNKINADLSLMELLINSGADCMRTDCYGKDLFFYINKDGDSNLVEAIKKILNKSN